MAHVNAELPEAVYDLPPAESLADDAGQHVPSEDALPVELLAENVAWFCHIRWVAIAALAALSFLSAWPAAAGTLGLRAGILWPIILAVILAIGNVGFLAQRRATADRPGRGAKLSLWSQIGLDLLILTAVVHFAGAGTYIHFAYLFHIVLACIFFPRVASLIVTLLAWACYGSITAAQKVGRFPAGSLFARPPGNGPVDETVELLTFNVLFFLAVLLTVWYLASHLSEVVRSRTRDLAGANRRLARAVEERTQHLLRTTHELKAPFAAIHANTQVLVLQYGQELPEGARSIVERNANRCRGLGDAIHEMLLLANLRSQSQQVPPPTPVDLAEVLTWCATKAQARAAERNVTIDCSPEPMQVVGVAERLRMLFTSLIDNAVRYSHSGGRVRITTAVGPQGRPMARIADDGIGIEAENLPHIFDEYYRTVRGALHNKESSGLGLAIVRRIARVHGHGVRVRSRVDAGTTFDVLLDSPTASDSLETRIEGV